MYRIALAIFLVFPFAAFSHESWLDLVAWQVAPGDVLRADIRVGQNMKGTSQRYLPGAYPRFEAAGPGGVVAPQGTIGDKPAMTIETGAPGIYLLTHVSRDYRLKYTDFEKFRAFTSHKDLGPLPSRHLARGLPETDFVELYTRYDKALAAVGDGAGQDRDLGLRTELTALANPYTDDLAGGMPVRLTWDGSPRAEAQIEVFERGPDEAEPRVFMVRTSVDGIAVIPVVPGNDYLLSAVKMVELEPLAPGDAVWHSHWASLTFHVASR